MNIRHAFAATAVFGLMSGAAQAESWNMPTPYPENNFHTVNISEFAADVAEATGGELEIAVHSAGSLIKHPEIKNAVRANQVPIGEFLLSRLSNDDALFGVDSVPFLASNYDAARKLWEVSREPIAAELAKENLKILFAVPWPPQGLYANKPVETVDDLKGLKFRAYNEATETIAELAGAVPTQIEVPDLPQAFATGRVDAMITSPSTGANTKAWDYVSHYYDVQAWLPKNVVVVNQEAFDALDEDTRKAVMEAAAKAEKRGWEASMAETESQTELLEKNGMTVSKPSDALKAGLEEIGDKMIADWVEAAGPKGKEIVEALK